MKLPLAILITISIIAFTYLSGLYVAIKSKGIDEDDDFITRNGIPILIGLVIDCLVLVCVGIFAVIYENI